MPIYRDLDTDAVAEYPETIGEHPVLGARLVLHDVTNVETAEPDSGEGSIPATPVARSRKV